MAEKKINPAPGKVTVVKPTAKTAGVPVKAGKGVTKEEPRKSLSDWIKEGTQFLQDVKSELKKVTWPPRKQTISSTGVVVGLVMIISLFLGLVDYVLTHLVRFLIS